MDGIKILHTGDLHLGMPFTGSKLPSHVGRLRRQELWETFDRIIQTVKDQRVNLLLIAGDLFEYNYCTMSDIKRINDGFARVPDTFICIAPGNHDPAFSDSMYETFRWQPNVHIFRHSSVSGFRIEPLNTTVWGLGWDRGEIRRPILEGFRAKGQGIEILMAHCDVVSKGIDSKYLPVHPEQLAASGIRYAALGHIHKGGAIENITGTKAVYCGSPEPLDFSEGGRHGVYIGTVDRNSCDVKFRPLAKRSFITKDINLDPSMTQDSIRQRIEKTIAAKGCDNLFRFVLEGSLDPEFEPDIEYLQQALDVFHLEIKNNALPGYDIEAILEDDKNSITGVFLSQLTRRIKNVTDPQKRAVLERALYIGLDALNGRRVIGR